MAPGVGGGGVPALEDAAVFENSTACATWSFGSMVASRFDPSPLGAAVQNPVKSERAHGVLGCAEQYGPDNFPKDSGAGAFGRRMTRKFFTESLILAQDERWRRA